MRAISIKKLDITFYTTKNNVMNSCPICSLESTGSGLHHTICDIEILVCNDCGYHYIDCNEFNNSDILYHQESNSSYFGKNFKRNEEYSKIISDVISKTGISNILEIGTPFNYDLLRRLHEEHQNNISLNSYDIIEFDTPDYITLYTDRNVLLNLKFDLIVCLHTLEHIPTNEILDFIQLCKSISRYQIFEVPNCYDRDMILNSQEHPHYSYFTEKTLSKIFGIEYNIQLRSDDRLLVIDNLKNKITFENEHN